MAACGNGGASGGSCRNADQRGRGAQRPQRAPIRSRWPLLAVLALASLLGAAAAPAAARQTGPVAVPILIYHHIDPAPGEYAITPEQLETHLTWLRENGYVGITPSELLWALDGGAPLPANPVMLTIDDGWASQAAFAEAVGRHGFRAAYFLPNYAQFAPEQIAALAWSGEVCGHTANHPRLAELPYDEQVREIVDNKTWLESIVGAPVTCFAYPFGSFTDETAGIVAEAGYQIAFTAWGGWAPLDGSLDRYRVQRINASGFVPLPELLAGTGATTP